VHKHDPTMAMIGLLILWQGPTKLPTESVQMAPLGHQTVFCQFYPFVSSLLLVRPSRFLALFFERVSTFNLADG